MHQNSPEWVVTNTVPTLAPKVVHVWRVNLQSDAGKILLFWKTLSGDEKVRANKFHFEALRNQYIICRGTLRKLLGQYLRQKPESIQFDYTAYGKPILRPSNFLQFNVSHSAGVGLIAFTLDASIGVDVEVIKNEINIKKLTRRFFSKNEAQYILDLAETDQHRSFFKCWTRKEAFIKGHGQGLSLPLDQFEVSISDELPVNLEAVQWDPKSASDWSLRSFNVGSDKLGAIAVEAQIEMVHLFESHGLSQS